MGLIGMLSGKGKIDLIKQLLIERISNDPIAQKSGFSKYQIDQLSDMDLLGSTEAAIVTIAETYFKLVVQGVSDTDAISRIEQHRSNLGRGAKAPPSTYIGFIHYRVSLEHKGPRLPDFHVQFCALAAEHFFGFLDDKGEASHSIKYAKYSQLSDKFDRVMGIFAQYFEGEVTEEELCSQAEEDMRIWIDVRNERRKKHAEGRFLMGIRELE